MITAQDLKGALAIMPTPAKEGADRLDATDTVDLDETARRTESLVRDGGKGSRVRHRPSEDRRGRGIRAGSVDAHSSRI